MFDFLKSKLNTLATPLGLIAVGSLMTVGLYLSIHGVSESTERIVQAVSVFLSVLFLGLMVWLTTIPTRDRNIW
ncbi:MAG: hypothetical protein KDB68_06780 [Planctomycetes bacterium]|nr:hypothetical protein [Planctomycetota bacterium]